MIPGPTDSDWSFDAIRLTQPARADLLELAPSPDDLIAALSDVLGQTVLGNDLRLAIDSRGNRWKDRRAIVQIRVTSELYDNFFNARTGYRGWFWVKADHGLALNARAVENLSAVLLTRLPARVPARRVEITFANGQRQENDAGTQDVPLCLIESSLAPAISKLWICEHLYHTDGQQPTPIYLSALRGGDPRLVVPRWQYVHNLESGATGEGCRAPFATDESAWIDLKGGFVDSKGAVLQEKSPKKRAISIETTGWT
jgi:hypothetical protein